MAHPSAAFPSEIFIIDADNIEAISNNNPFYAITCVVAGSGTTQVSVKGGGIFVDDSGYSEADAGTYQTIPLAEGMTTYGSFTHVKTVSAGTNGKFVAYR